MDDFCEAVIEAVDSKTMDSPSESTAMIVGLKIVWLGLVLEVRLMLYVVCSGVVCGGWRTPRAPRISSLRLFEESSGFLRLRPSP